VSLSRKCRYNRLSSAYAWTVVIHRVLLQDPRCSLNTRRTIAGKEWNFEVLSTRRKRCRHHTQRGMLCRKGRIGTTEERCHEDRTDSRAEVAATRDRRCRRQLNRGGTEQTSVLHPPLTASRSANSSLQSQCCGTGDIRVLHRTQHAVIVEERDLHHPSKVWREMTGSRLACGSSVSGIKTRFLKQRTNDGLLEFFREGVS